MSEHDSAGGRDGRGRFATGNLAALKHGGRSQQVQRGLLPDQAEALAALAEARSEIEGDLGGVDVLSRLTRDTVARYLELSLVAGYLADRLVTEGPLTGKGRQRAALTAYLGVVDRLSRLAQQLGFEKQVKKVGLDDVLQKYRQQ
jgi:hypothetical protein